MVIVFYIIAILQGLRACFLLFEALNIYNLLKRIGI
jgi:hypothetical protein